MIPMKVSFKKKIDFTAIDSNFVLTLHSLVKILQEAAIKHSSQAGLGSKQLIDDGSVWILYQYGIQIDKWAVYEEDIEVVTWHRGMKGFKAYREFEVYSGNQIIAAASAVYLYYDIKNQKIKRIPKIQTLFIQLKRERLLRMILNNGNPFQDLTPLLI